MHFLFLLMALYAATGKAGSFPMDESERLHEVVAMTNRERARRELPPLKVNSTLAAAAQAHARDMARKRYYAHEDADGTGPDERCRRLGYLFWSGENIFMGPQSARSAMEGWMQSPEHRRNILSPVNREIGVGFARGDRGEPYWVQLFGAPPDTFPVIINGEDRATASAAVRLYIHGEGNVTRIRFLGENGDFTEWEPFTPERAWRLEPGEGLRTVTVEVMDESEIVFRSSDTILLRPPKRISRAGVAPPRIASLGAAP